MIASFFANKLGSIKRKDQIYIAGKNITVADFCIASIFSDVMRVNIKLPTNDLVDYEQPLYFRRMKPLLKKHKELLKYC